MEGVPTKLIVSNWYSRLDCSQERNAMDDSAVEHIAKTWSIELYGSTEG